MAKGDKGPKRPEVGVVFPLDPRKGDRSSTFGNKGAWAAASGAADPAEAEKIQRERNWRQNYTKYIVKQVQLSLKSRDTALAVAEAGLEYIYQNFEFIRDGKTYKLEEALSTFKTHNYTKGVIKGSGKLPQHGHEVEINYKGGVLKGEKLKKKLRDWVEYGTIEASAATALESVIDNYKWLDLSKKYFVLLGAGSAMGPLLTLLKLGANIIAIDLDLPVIWARLIREARKSPGTLIFPSKIPLTGDESDEVIAANAGGNLFTDLPELRNWLVQLDETQGATVGAYAYLDGDRHVKVSVAMDTIIRDLTQKKKAACAYLCTPTDVHVITEEANKAARENYSAFSLVNLVLKLSLFNAPGSPYLVKNALKPITSDDGQTYYIVDGIVNRQGPNYALAKRIQHWRAMVAREKAGVVVSTNIAPSTATVSVTSNKLFALAYNGWKFFKPLEVFEQETSNSVMATMLIHDVSKKGIPADPAVRLRNPLELFTYGSWHGGVWRQAYKIDSMGEPAAFLYIFTHRYAILFYVALLAIVVQRLGLLG